jgi:hypothetical protein
VETSVPLLMCRSYPLSVEDAYCRRRIFTVTQAFLAVAYAILVRTRFALCGRRHRLLGAWDAPNTNPAQGSSRRLVE